MTQQERKKRLHEAGAVTASLVTNLMSMRYSGIYQQGPCDASSRVSACQCQVGAAMPFPVLFSITSTFSLCVPLNKILASTAFLKKGFIEPKMPAPKKAGLGV